MPDKTDKTFKKRDRGIAILIGIGLALSPIHNQWLTDLVTGSSGEVGFFIPSFGVAIWLMGSLMFVVWNWERLDWGSKKIWIPLLIIVAAIGLSGIPREGITNKLAPILLGISLFGLYLTARTVGREIFLPLAIGVCIADCGIIISAIANPGVVTGGLIFEHNYDIVVGYVMLGTALYFSRFQWQLAGISLLCLFLTGSPEAVFSVAVIGIVLLIRRDWSRRIIVPAVGVVVIAGAYFGAGYGQSLYDYAFRILHDDPITPYLSRDSGIEERSAIGYRVTVIRETMQDIQPLGTGYSITEFRTGTVHNVPLVIVQQLGWPGIIAGLCWLWITIWCLVKTKWKYVWVLVPTLSVFDHYIWTQLAPWWWAIVGASTASNLRTDTVFKRWRR